VINFIESNNARVYAGKCAPTAASAQTSCLDLAALVGFLSIDCFIQIVVGVITAPFNAAPMNAPLLRE
jgi:hypothetical protein